MNSMNKQPVADDVRLWNVACMMALALREADGAVRGALVHQAIRDALMAWDGLRGTHNDGDDEWERDRRQGCISDPPIVKNPQHIDGPEEGVVEFTDRYQALGIPYPDPETMCKGDCEATGYVPVKYDTMDPVYRPLWIAAEEAEPSDDGWHFVVCPRCSGTRLEPELRDAHCPDGGGAQSDKRSAADDVRAAAENVLRFGRMISKRTWQLAQRNVMHGLTLEGFDEALDVLESALQIDGTAAHDG